MKYGYMALLMVSSVFAMVYGLLNQIGNQPWWAFAYTVVTLLGSTSMYLVGWRFSNITTKDKESKK